MEKEILEKLPSYITDLNWIMVTKFGSHLYGTNTEDSDLDFKGVYMPTKEQIILGRVPKSVSFKTNNSNKVKNSKDDLEIEMFSLHYFIKLACEGQTIALDMLHTPYAYLSCTSKIWDDLYLRRKRFNTKSLTAFVGYARRQASKYGIKGSRINAMRSFLDCLNKYSDDTKLDQIWEYLPNGEHIHTDQVDPHNIKIYQICGKKFQATAKVGYIKPTIERFLRDYGKRAKEAAENKNIDWKAVSHAIRAAMEVKQILLKGKITFPLEEADYLKEIKQGKLDYMSIVAPDLERRMDELEDLIECSKLPKEVNMSYWDAWLFQVCRYYINVGIY